MACINRYAQENLISKILVNLNFALPSYALLCALQLLHRLIFSFENLKHNAETLEMSMLLYFQFLYFMGLELKMNLDFTWTVTIV